jgi:hypothetical protein
MGIESTRPMLPRLENKRFCRTPNPKCDRRVNFRGMWDHLGLRKDTSNAREPGLQAFSRGSPIGAQKRKRARMVISLFEMTEAYRSRYQFRPGRRA